MYNAEKLTSIDLGRQGENLARTVEIDVSVMLAQWPDASITLLFKRKHDAEPYIADTAVENGVLIWPITKVETADAGDGKLEIRATYGEVIAKSATGSFRVTASLTGGGTEPPETEQGWVEKVLAAGAGVEQNASLASEAADRAEAAAETAESSIAQVQSDAQTAAAKAEEAKKSAETASIANTNAAASAKVAQEAQADAQEAGKSAADSALAAEQATLAAEAAQKAAVGQATAAGEAAQAAAENAREAQTNANAAAASAEEANAAAAQAAQEAQAASDAKGQAEDARDNAKTSEEAAASSATAAKASEDAASGSAKAASDAAADALERLNGAEAARDAAEAAQEVAEDSAAQAEQSAAKAEEAAQTALGILDDSVLLVKDKDRLDKLKTMQFFSDRLKRNAYRGTREYAYKNIKPRVFAEKYLGGQIIDYKFYCFNGNPRFLYVSKGIEREGTLQPVDKPQSTVNFFEKPEKTKRKRQPSRRI